MEVRLDQRLLTLAAALTAASAPAQGPEHLLVAQTREHPGGFKSHPSVRWLQNQYKQSGLLGLAMQAVQLGGPPAFDPSSPDGVPAFVDQYFADVDRTELAHALRSFWQDAGFAGLLESQAAQWRSVVAELQTLLGETELEAFQQQFFGRFPYTAVLVPLWNMATCGLRGVGVASTRETYAVCLPESERTRLLVLAQHEASHPVLDDVQRLYPEVPAACAFIERRYPPEGSFARAYGDPTFRWVETVIRASTYFYLHAIRRPADAEVFLEAQVKEGVTAIRPVVDALRPWWQERSRGSAPGLDGVLQELPGWLGAAASPAPSGR